MDEDASNHRNGDRAAVRFISSISLSACAVESERRCLANMRDTVLSLSSSSELGLSEEDGEADPVRESLSAFNKVKSASYFGRVKKHSIIPSTNPSHSEAPTGDLFATLLFTLYLCQSEEKWLLCSPIVSSVLIPQRLHPIAMPTPSGLYPLSAFSTSFPLTAVFSVVAPAPTVCPPSGDRKAMTWSSSCGSEKA